VDHLWKHYPGASYHSVYEAGFCGFWIHRELQAHGVHNIVVNPADVPTRAIR
jgi:transposase